jgi:glycine C-acetyltransferase
MLARPTSRFASSKLREVLSSNLDAIRAAGTYKSERVIKSPQGPEVILTEGNKKFLNFCANNYLGLSNHTEIREAAKAAIDSHGYGMSSVRFICGTTNLHKQLESTLSNFHGMEDTILYPSCFDANAGIFEGLLTEEDAVLSDALNHASIIDGIRLCKAQRFRYKHLDMKDLEHKLEESKNARIRLIVTDGVFSMDGDIAPLDKIRRLADKYPNTYILVDECHATGVFGNQGRGTPDLFGVKVDIINSTLGKALGGGLGGYTSATREVVDMLRQKSRPYLFSNSIPPAVAGASIKALELLQRPDLNLQSTLLDNTQYFRSRMHDAGFNILGNSKCPIVPVLIGDARLSGLLAEELLGRGIYVTSFSYPVVPKDTARIRVQISAAHTKQQLSKLIAAFIGAGKDVGVLDRYTAEAYEKLTDEKGKNEENPFNV